jgi:hypothetical protein
MKESNEKKPNMIRSFFKINTKTSARVTRRKTIIQIDLKNQNRLVTNTEKLFGSISKQFQKRKHSQHNFIEKSVLKNDKKLGIKIIVKIDVKIDPKID